MRNLASMLTIVIAVSLSSSTSARADVAGYSEAWSYEEYQEEWDGLHSSDVFSMSISDSDIGDYVSVGETVYDPSYNVVAWGANDGWDFVREDLTMSTDPENTPEGDWAVEGWHSDGYTGAVQSLFGFGSTTYFTRYAYDSSYVDYLGRFHWVYLPYNCLNLCTAPFRDFIQNQPEAPGFLGYSGVRWSFAGFTIACKMSGRALPEQWTRCQPLV